MTDPAPSRGVRGADRPQQSVSTDRLPLAARRHPLVAEVRRRLMRYADLTGAAPMVVGVSGGPDSIALLVALLAIREQQSAGVRPEPIIAHVNHHLREDASTDAAFVQALGDRLRIPTVVRDVHPDRQEANLAAAARSLRYQALGEIAGEVGATCVAVGHHAEDQFETILMALCRGAGLDGISAMAWSRPLTSTRKDIALVRPLLASRKAECESLCDAAGIAWREDQSNQDRSRRRNRLRHEVMPILESCWPNAPVRAAVTADLLHEAMRLVEDELARHFGPASQRRWPRETLNRLTPVLIAAGLRRAAIDVLNEQVHGDGLTQRVLLPAAEAIVDADDAPREFALTGGLVVIVRANTVELRQE